jgi:energy-coupling factor transporter ATP-binding protein EcfA2
MFFEYVRLEGCDRTSLNGSNVITIRPTTKAQMVLGTNGSGKSSLLEIGFSPLPPDAEYFPNGGSLDQTILHKGHVYKLNSTFGAKNSYSFIVDDGENLNKGRTVTAQLELVKIHLGYDRMIHKFVTGGVKFTKLSVMERRDWFARFSPTNFDFAFSKYNAWKKELSSRVSLIKYLKERILETQDLLHPEEERISMRKHSAELHDTLEMLLREPRQTTEPVTEARLEELTNKLDSVTTDFLFQEYPDTLGAESFDDLDKMLRDVRDEILLVQGELRFASDRYAECDRLRELTEKSMKVDPQYLRTSLSQLQSDYDAIPEFVTGVHASLLINAAKPISELRMVIADLPRERKSESDVRMLQEAVFEKRMRYNRAGNLMELIKQEIDQIHSCEEVTCPSCRTEFKPGVEPGKLEELKARLGNGEKIFTEMSNDVELAEEIFEVASLSAEAYARLEEIRATYQGQFPGLFVYLDSVGWQELGRSLIGRLAIYERDAIYAEKKLQIERAIATVSAQLVQYESESGNSEKIMADYRQAQERYDDVHFRIRLLKDREQIVINAMYVWTKYGEQYKLGISLYEELKSDILSYCNYQGDLQIEDLIRKTKLGLASIELTLSEQETLENLLKDSTNQLAMVEIERMTYARLVDEICPKKGLLSEMIHMQMSTVINTANKIIRRLWGYPLFMSTCAADENGIDYKIPMMVADRPRSDIAKGSTSIKDVIDEAFVITGYYCMQLTDFPLHLDEIGSSFDEAHRHNLLPMIKDLVDDNHFSQVFIISHQLDGQTAFPSSQTIIMDTRNITFPHPYNQHVEFD